MKAISLKLENKQIRLLDEASKATHVSKSALIRRGIDMVLVQAKEDVLSQNFRAEVDALIAEDKDLLKKLSDAGRAKKLKSVLDVVNKQHNKTLRSLSDRTR